jgi:hypothetical protein
MVYRTTAEGVADTEVRGAYTGAVVSGHAECRASD